MNIEDQLMQLDERSEYARDVLGKLPAWLLRWGSALVLGMVLLLLALGWLLKYPDIIQAPIVLTTDLPPVRVVAPVAGELRIINSSTGPVAAFSPVALIVNPVSWEALSDIKQWLAGLDLDGLDGLDSLDGSDGASDPVGSDDAGEFEVITPPGPSPAIQAPVTALNLGELQPSFNDFYQQYETYAYLLHEKAGERRQLMLQEQRHSLQALLARQQAQLSTMAEQQQLSQASLERFQQLQARQMVSVELLDEKKTQYLNTIKEEKMQHALIAETQVDISRLESEILNVKINRDELLQTERIKLTSAYNRLLSDISQWEHNYLLRAPLDGFVSWSRYWSSHQHVRAGDDVFTVVPASRQTVIGKVPLPMQNSGKVRIGQRVFIKLEGFPYQEFGILAGEVQHIGLAPNEQRYDILVRLPQPLVTSFNKTLPLKQEMLGRAEIVTEDLRLLERIYYQLVNALRQG